MSRNIKNKALKAAYAERNSPVIFHMEDTENGHKAIYLVQDVAILNNIGEGSALSLAAFVGEGSGVRECLRAITVVPADHAIAAMEVGDSIPAAAIKIWRSTEPFRDENSQKGGYPSQAVLNPKKGLIVTRDGLPIFEHRMVVVADPEKEYVYDLGVDGEPGTTTSKEVTAYLQADWEVEEDRADKAAQIDFEVIPDEKMKTTLTVEK
jgi:hypothetical protein